MRVNNMTSNRSGRAVANQFIISDEGHGANGNFIRKEVFQSYKTIIAERVEWSDRTDVTLDTKWDCSMTTGKYRNQFLGENKAATERKIKSGEYKIENLNKN